MFADFAGDGSLSVEDTVGMKFPNLRRHLVRGLLLFSLCCICFTYGLAAGRHKLFPYPIIRDAWTATRALVEADQKSPNAGLASYKRRVLVPTVTSFAPTVGEELLLVSGGAGYLKDHHPAGCLAWLMDRQGNIKHIWKHYSTLWDDLQHVAQVPTVSGAPYPVGLHLFNNGGLLVTYHAVNTFPYAVGIARFDVNSKLL